MRNIIDLSKEQIREDNVYDENSDTDGKDEKDSMGGKTDVIEIDEKPEECYPFL